MVCVLVGSLWAVSMLIVIINMRRSPTYPKEITASLELVKEFHSPLKTKKTKKKLTLILLAGLNLGTIRLRPKKR